MEVIKRFVREAIPRVKTNGKIFFEMNERHPNRIKYFLEENCFGSCPINCIRDLDGIIDQTRLQGDKKIRRKLELIQSFLVGNLDKEQCLRLDLMNHVILDSLLQFYSEEMSIEFEENDIILLELAEFIENVILD